MAPRLRPADAGMGGVMGEPMVTVKIPLSVAARLRLFSQLREQGFNVHEPHIKIVGNGIDQWWWYVDAEGESHEFGPRLRRLVANLALAGFGAACEARGRKDALLIVAAAIDEKEQTSDPVSAWDEWARESGLVEPDRGEP